MKVWSFRPPDECSEHVCQPSGRLRARLREALCRILGLLITGAGRSSSTLKTNAVSGSTTDKHFWVVDVTKYIFNLCWADLNHVTQPLGQTGGHSLWSFHSFSFRYSS